jgi:hypothetical protein
VLKKLCNKDSKKEGKIQRELRKMMSSKQIREDLRVKRGSNEKHSYVKRAVPKGKTSF